MEKLLHKKRNLQIRGTNKHTELNTFKYHVLYIDGKISVRINLFYLYFPPSFHLTDKHTIVRWNNGGK